MSKKDDQKVQEQRELVQRIMDRTGLSLSALAVAAGFSHTTLTRWWKEGTELRPGTINRLLALSPESDQGPLERDALLRALTFALEAAGFPPTKSAMLSGATLSVYRQLVLGGEFATDEAGRRAARIAYDTAEHLLN